MKHTQTACTAIALLGAAMAAPALANDSEAAIALGGIELVQNNMISMDSEDLFISADEVRVAYRFTNRSAKDIETLASFPLPAIPGGLGPWYGDGQIPDLSRLDFRTTIDGKPAKLTVIEKAEVNGRDVTVRVKALGWPVSWFTGEGSAPDFVHKLTPAQRDGYIKEGLLRRERGASGVVLPAWDMVTHVTRRQTFLAGKTVTVTHRYVPITGGSVAGSLYPEARKYPDWKDYAGRYCIDKSFLAAFDSREALNRKNKPDSPAINSETWIGYVLSSGRNWRGPIKQFRLVIDKGKPGNLVSFCMDGVKKISPTRFEVRKTNFEPKGDLEIVIAQWHETD